jgi:HicB-like protein involved in pilus formation
VAGDRKAADEVVKLQLRLPKTLHRRLVRQAKLHRTSLNTEILRALDLYGGSDDQWMMRREAIEALVKRTTAETVNVLAERLGITPTELETDVLLTRLRTADRGARANAISDATEAAVKLLCEQNRSLDEHAAREQVNAMIENVVSRETESDHVRALAVNAVLVRLRSKRSTLIVQPDVLISAVDDENK